LGCLLRDFDTPGFNCGDEESRAIVHGLVLGAGLCANAFLLLVDFVAAGLIGAASVAKQPDDLVALVALLDVDAGAVCEASSLSIADAGYSGGLAG
jgi:hypothetical protein